MHYRPQVRQTTHRHIIFFCSRAQVLPSCVSVDKKLSWPSFLPFLFFFFFPLRQPSIPSTLHQHSSISNQTSLQKQTHHGYDCLIVHFLSKELHTREAWSTNSTYSIFIIGVLLHPDYKQRPLDTPLCPSTSLVVAFLFRWSVGKKKYKNVWLNNHVEMKACRVCCT